MVQKKKKALSCGETVPPRDILRMYRLRGRAAILSYVKVYKV